MANKSTVSAASGDKEPVAGDAVEQPEPPVDSRSLDDLHPGEFNVENIERIYG